MNIGQLTVNSGVSQTQVVALYGKNIFPFKFLVHVGGGFGWKPVCLHLFLSLSQFTLYMIWWTPVHNYIQHVRAFMCSWKQWIGYRVWKSWKIRLLGNLTRSFVCTKCSQTAGTFMLFSLGFSFSLCYLGNLPMIKFADCNFKVWLCGKISKWNQLLTCIIRAM